MARSAPVRVDQVDHDGLFAFDLKGAAEGVDGFVLGVHVLLFAHEPLVEKADADAVEGGEVLGVELDGLAEVGEGFFVLGLTEEAGGEALVSDGGGLDADELLEGVLHFRKAADLAQGLAEVQEELWGEVHEFGGLLVFDDRILIVFGGGVDGAEVEAGGAAVAFELDGAFGVGKAGRGLTVLEVGRGEVEVGVEVVGAEPDGVDVCADGVGEAAQLLEGEGVVVLSVEVGGFDFRGLLVLDLGLGGVAALFVDVADTEEGGGHLGVDDDGVFELFESDIEEALLFEFVGAIDGGFGVNDRIDFGGLYRRFDFFGGGGGRRPRGPAGGEAVAAGVGHQDGCTKACGEDGLPGC